jgi:uncharacterized protein YbbC (DUF1343 family)
MKNLLLIIIAFSTAAAAQNRKAPTEIMPAAYRTQVYVPMLKGKRVAIFANHTATIGTVHLVDTLLKLGVNITVAFGPEHGFRGTADAGEKVDTYIDPTTKIPVISLYGKKRKPTPEDLKDVDIMLFDIQDVGTRFYTYISSLQEYMEAAFENSKPLMILDRPNPNGFYVDGPVLDTAYKSFVGMNPIPTVYGMTIGEYAFMVAGEQWLSPKANEKYAYYKTAENSKDTAFHFQLIKCASYTHSSKYILPIKPSPNLPDMASIYWYASTCLFEGTVLSEGRGTEHPFCIFGHPSLPKTYFPFTPQPMEGAKEPKLKGQQCYGWNLYGPDAAIRQVIGNQVQIKYILDAYKLFPDKENFFIKPKSGNMELSFFNKLAGNKELMQQIKDGKTEAEIRASWKPKLDAFKEIRKKYLMYEDFE